MNASDGRQMEISLTASRGSGLPVCCRAQIFRIRASRSVAGAKVKAVLHREVGGRGMGAGKVGGRGWRESPSD